MPENPTTALAPVNYAVMTYQPTDLAQIINDNLGGATIDPSMLDRVVVPSGGSTTWTVPTLEGEIETKTIEGILVGFTDPKAYWLKSMEETGGGTPPDCSSIDGVIGVANTPDGPGGMCSTCPLNQWGSDPKGGKGKACKDMRNMFIVREGNILPMVVTLPPTSLAPMRQFMLRLASMGLHYTAATIKLELEKVKNDGGIWYAKVKPSLGQKLLPEQAAHMKQFAEAIKPVLQRVTVIEATAS